MSNLSQSASLASSVASPIKLSFQPPPPLNLKMKHGILKIDEKPYNLPSNNFQAFITAQMLSIEEGTAQDYIITTSPSLTHQEKEEKEKTKNKTVNTKIKFNENKPTLYLYTPETSDDEKSK
jgi:hypothetical protein